MSVVQFNRIFVLVLSVALRSRALREGYPDPVERAGVFAQATRRLPGLGRPA